MIPVTEQEVAGLLGQFQVGMDKPQPQSFALWRCDQKVQTSSNKGQLSRHRCWIDVPRPPRRWPVSSSCSPVVCSQGDAHRWPKAVQAIAELPRLWCRIDAPHIPPEAHCICHICRGPGDHPAHAPGQHEAATALSFALRAMHAKAQKVQSCPNQQTRANKSCRSLGHSAL